MKDLLCSDHYCNKILTLVMESSAYPPSFYIREWRKINTLFASFYFNCLCFEFYWKRENGADINIWCLTQIEFFNEQGTNFFG